MASAQICSLHANTSKRLSLYGKNGVVLVVRDTLPRRISQNLRRSEGLFRMRTPTMPFLRHSCANKALETIQVSVTPMHLEGTQIAL